MLKLILMLRDGIFISFTTDVELHQKNAANFFDKEIVFWNYQIKHKIPRVAWILVSLRVLNHSMASINSELYLSRTNTQKTRICTSEINHLERLNSNEKNAYPLIINGKIFLLISVNNRPSIYIKYIKGFITTTSS